MKDCQMRELKGLLERSIQRRSKNKNVAVLLSGGVDSISTAFAAQNVGKTIHAYSFHLDSHLSYDFKKAQEISHKYGWKFKGITIPTKYLKRDFKRLVSLGCKTKVSFETAYPFLYVYPEIKQKEVLSGWGADGFFGLSRKAKQHYRHTKKLFDSFRNDYFLPHKTASVGFQRIIANQHKKTFIAPYLEKEVKNFFFQFDWFELNTKPQKKIIRDAFDQFEQIKVNRHANLQINSKTNELFETLLRDKEINFRNRVRVKDLCFDWHRKTNLNP